MGRREGEEEVAAATWQLVVVAIKAGDGKSC
jgi:hypothetical protein